MPKALPSAAGLGTDFTFVEADASQQNGMAAVIDLASTPNSTALKLPSSSHRLPSVSAAEAFQALSDANSGPSVIPTGIHGLDDALGGGIEVGKVTELWGPIGAGKTAIALATATHAMEPSGTVVWLDTSTPLVPRRLPTPSPGSTNAAFITMPSPTLPHLLALLLHPPSTFPPPHITLLVLPNLHHLLESSHPRNPTFPAATPVATQKWAASRRYAILGTLITALNRVAVMHNIAVLAITGCATRQRPGMPLGLVPGVGGGEWEAGVWNRVVVYRDFGVRVAGVQKGRGSAVAAGMHGLGTVAGFTVDGSGGAVPLEASTGEPSEGGAKVPGVTLHPSPVRGLPIALPRKRAFDEIADSDDEEGVDEYGGWADVEDDVALVADAVDSTAAAAIDLT
ncbi:hypothetical protein B0A48_09201 [Cryoendolithus antarcticus]|uniref:RecA-like N-terminal domain-containing protein n=1 Tax=Cryoendolithus antarcticus TaxID=1507870 RepID=A0A1V8T2P8_9PEZI|nr:hypothetical protein B0A48_09201 [Cryoendolithus antarcticus]